MKTFIFIFEKQNFNKFIKIMIKNRRDFILWSNEDEFLGKTAIRCPQKPNHNNFITIKYCSVVVAVVICSTNFQF